MPRKKQRKYSRGLIIILLFAIQMFGKAAFGQDSVSGYSEIEGVEKSLNCCDDTARLRPEQSRDYDEEGIRKPGGPSSNLSGLWELDTGKPRNKFSIMPHRSTFILPVTYNSRPNLEPFRQASLDDDVLNTEVKYQISVKIKLWQDVLGRDMDLWFGYTQQSFWQFYNFADSAPFRETNYEPELLLNFRTNFNFIGMRGRIINIGLNHQSNGQSRPLSRSWNRIVGNIGFEKDNMVILLKSWYRVPEKKEDDDNPDIQKFTGYGELWGYYFLDGHRIGVMLRNNLRPNSNRGALQVEWSFPLKLIKNVSGHLQFFTGYGESLLDYDHNVRRLGIGFIICDWN